MVSLLSNSSAPAPAKIHLASVELLGESPKAKIISPKKTATLAAASGSTQALKTLSDTFDQASEKFVRLRQSIYRELTANLKGRPSNKEVVLALKFSTAGELTATDLVRSSGIPALDDEVLEILKNADLYSSAEFANLNIQVPVRLR